MLIQQRGAWRSESSQEDSLFIFPRSADVLSIPDSWVSVYYRWTLKDFLMTSRDKEHADFAFRKNDDIGAAGAEDDAQFLSDCFVDTGELKVLVDCENPKRIVVGRTGTGKTASLTEVEDIAQMVIPLSPHSLSLNYIANNTVIQIFRRRGCKSITFLRIALEAYHCRGTAESKAPYQNRRLATYVYEPATRTAFNRSHQRASRRLSGKMGKQVLADDRRAHPRTYQSNRKQPFRLPRRGD